MCARRFVIPKCRTPALNPQCRVPSFLAYGVHLNTIAFSALSPFASVLLPCYNSAVCGRKAASARCSSFELGSLSTERLAHRVLEAGLQFQYFSMHISDVKAPHLGRYGTAARRKNAAIATSASDNTTRTRPKAWGCLAVPYC